MHKTFTPNQKAAVALAAITGEKTTAQISSEHTVHPTQIGVWKKHLLDNLASLFVDRRQADHKTTERKMNELYQLIGKRETEIEWLKKKMQPFVATDTT